MEYPQFTIGADPELFLEDINKDQLVSSVGIIEGTKDEPEYLKDGTFVMKDNVAIEFGMKPCWTEEEWLDVLADSYTQLNNHLPEHLRLVCLASAEFPETELQTEEACQFGCDPDYNAWTKKRNKPPKATQTNFRSCGGHVHVGHINGSTTHFLLEKMGKINTVRMMDAFLGVPSIILDNNPASQQRRQLYGKAGCHRETDYGVEYRTLSNFWLKSPAMQKYIYRATADVLRLMDEDYKDSAMFVGKNGRLIQRIINNSDLEQANDWVHKIISPAMGRFTVRAYESALKEVRDE
jgi:hypothetical protein